MTTVQVYGDTWTACKQALTEAIEDATARGYVWVQSIAPFRQGSQFTAAAKFVREE